MTCDPKSTIINFFSPVHIITQFSIPHLIILHLLLLCIFHHFSLFFWTFYLNLINNFTLFFFFASFHIQLCLCGFSKCKRKTVKNTRKISQLSFFFLSSSIAFHAQHFHFQCCKVWGGKESFVCTIMRTSSFSHFLLFLLNFFFFKIFSSFCIKEWQRN